MIAEIFCFTSIFLISFIYYYDSQVKKNNKHNS